MATRKPAAKKAAARKSPAPRVEGPVTDGAPLPTPGETAAAFPAQMPAATSFHFGLKEDVTITASGEQGTVRARAEYASGAICYLVAYKSARGEFREGWIDEDMLTGESL